MTVKLIQMDLFGNWLKCLRMVSPSEGPPITSADQFCTNDVVKPVGCICCLILLTSCTNPTLFLFPQQKPLGFFSPSSSLYGDSGGWVFDTKYHFLVIFYLSGRNKLKGILVLDVFASTCCSVILAWKCKTLNKCQDAMYSRGLEGACVYSSTHAC